MRKSGFVTWADFEAHRDKDWRVVHGIWPAIRGVSVGPAPKGAISPHTHVKVDIIDTPWAWADVSKTGSNLTDLATRQHAGLTDVTANQHHAQAHTLASHTTKPHSALTDVLENQHHNKVHALTGTHHTASGLTIGWVIKATGATTFAWGQLPHDKLAGLGDDDHTQYLLASGARALTAAWDAGSYQIRALKFYSDQATGTPPLTVLSTTMVTNLNADRLHNVVISGLTVGHVLKATAAAAIAFQANNLNGLSDVALNKYKTATAYDVLTRNSDGDWCAQEIETVVYKYPFKSYEIEWEFWTSTPPAPWAYGAISGGSASGVSATSHHPGSIRVLSGSPANSGYYWVAANNNLILSGKEQADFVFKTASSWTSRMNRFGFQDSITIMLPTDGAYLDMNGRYLTGKTRAGGAGSTTGTGYNLSANTWYRVRIIVNSNASLITFLLYSAAGSQLWTNTLSTNIPTAATGFGMVSYYTVAASGTHTITMDLAYLVCARGLVR